VLAPYVAVAICRAEPWKVPSYRWLGRVPRGAVAMALIVGAAVATSGIRTLHVEGVLPVAWMPWTAIGATAVLTLPLVPVFARLPRLLALTPVRRALPAFGLGVVFAAYSQSLPWPWIYANPEFPQYESRRVARERACELVRERGDSGPIMTSAPAEVRLYTGHPAVLLPITHDPPTIEALHLRYGVRYLLARRDEIEPRHAQALALEPVMRRLGYVLYRFPDPPALSAGGTEQPPVSRACTRRGPTSPSSARDAPAR
jgi:hypothetical protein